jgi:putative transposase
MATAVVSIDFLVVPTVSFRILYVFIVVAHHRRHAIHFNVTDHPTAEWTAQQIVEAFPWESGPRYLLHDRDCIYGAEFHQRVGKLGILEVLTAGTTLRVDHQSHAEIVSSNRA